MYKRYIVALIALWSLAAVAQTEMDPVRMFNKIAKLRLEESLRQQVLQHTFELCRGPNGYPIEHRKLQELPGCSELLNEIALIAGPKKISKLVKEYNHAIDYLNDQDPDMSIGEWCALGGCALGVAALGTGVVAGGVILVPKMAIALGMMKGAAATGGAAAVIPATTGTPGSGAIAIGLKIAALAGGSTKTICGGGAAVAVAGLKVVATTAGPLIAQKAGSLVLRKCWEELSSADSSTLKDELERQKKIKKGHWCLSADLRSKLQNKKEAARAQK